MHVYIAPVRGESRISEGGGGVKILKVHPTSIKNAPKSYTVFCFKHQPCIMQDFEHILVNLRVFPTIYELGGVVGATP